MDAIVILLRPVVLRANQLRISRFDGSNTVLITQKSGQTRKSVRKLKVFPSYLTLYKRMESWLKLNLEDLSCPGIKGNAYETNSFFWQMELGLLLKLDEKSIEKDSCSQHWGRRYCRYPLSKVVQLFLLFSRK